MRPYAQATKASSSAAMRMSQASASENPAPGRGAVHRRDHRIGDAPQVDDRRVQRLGPPPNLGRQVDRVVFDPGFEAVDVAAGAEGLAGAGDDQRPQRGLVGEPGEGGPQVQDHLGAHRVEALGPIEGEGADLAVDLDSQRAQLGGIDGRLGGHLAISVSVSKVGQLARSLPFGL